MELTEEPIILNKENDYLGSLEKAIAIKKFIENDTEHLLKNNMIAIYGEWGSGKSSLMRTIDKKLEDTKYKKIWIDMWQEESDYSNLSIKILNKILQSIGLEKENIKELLKAFIILGKGIKITTPIISCDMDKAFDYLEKEIDNTNKIEVFIKAFQEKIEKYMKQNSKKIIVFLDDLDRCNSENMLNIIYNIKLLLSVNNVIFIFGIDKEAVSLALKNKYNNEINKAENFLDKIFPISFNMPNNAFNFQKLINNFFKDMKKEKLKIIEEFFIKINFMNPRKLKKVFLRYSIIKNNLIEKELLDEEKEWNIIWILFLIIENEFEEKNYYFMLKNNKKDILCSKIYFEKGNTSIRHLPGYNEYKLSALIKEKEDKILYIPIELFEFILNPDEIIRDSIPIYAASNDTGLVFDSNLWFDLFKDSISKRFCLFFFENYRKCIINYGENIDKFLNIRYLLIQEIDKLM